jgi:hypothetical protein
MAGRKAAAESSPRVSPQSYEMNQAGTEKSHSALYCRENEFITFGWKQPASRLQ